MVHDGVCPLCIVRMREYEYILYEELLVSWVSSFERHSNVKIPTMVCTRVENSKLLVRLCKSSYMRVFFSYFVPTLFSNSRIDFDQELGSNLIPLTCYPSRGVL